MAFEGYSPETIDFLWGVRMNNNRTWFQANKQQYVEKLYEPTKALGKALFEPFIHRSGDILKVSRIYRDTRLKHPDPYKESLWICIRRDGEYWGEIPSLFFEITPEGVSYGFLFWRPKPAAMEHFRQVITAKKEEFLALVHSVEETTGLPVEAECYKRPKECADPELAPYFAWKNYIRCTVSEPVSEAIFGPALGKRVQTLLTQLIPLYDFFNGI